MPCASTIPRRICVIPLETSAPGPSHLGTRETHFAFEKDNGSLERAAERCVGVGACRNTPGRRHVPQLSRHRRGTALHARPRPSAVGDARRSAARRRLPEPGRPRGPRPLPQLQSLQIRVPGAGGHGRLQIGVSGAALQGPPAPAPPLHFRICRPTCPLRLARPGPDQRAAHRPAHQPAHQAHRRRSAGAATASPGAEKLPEGTKLVGRSTSVGWRSRF